MTTVKFTFLSSLNNLSFTLKVFARCSIELGRLICASVTCILYECKKKHFVPIFNQLTGKDQVTFVSRALMNECIELWLFKCSKTKLKNIYFLRKKYV